MMIAPHRSRAQEGRVIPLQVRALADWGSSVKIRSKIGNQKTAFASQDPPFQKRKSKEWGIPRRKDKFKIVSAS